MAAVYVINQPTGAGPGAAGISRKDLWQNQAVVLLCVTAENDYSWDVLDKPPGSTVPASLGSGPLAQSVSFTPDLPGTYRIRLITNGGASSSIRLVAVTKDSTGVVVNRGWRFLAFDERDDEANFAGNTRGYTPDWEFILADIIANLGGGGPPSGGAETGAPARASSSRSYQFVWGASFPLVAPVGAPTNVRPEIVKSDTVLAVSDLTAQRIEVYDTRDLQAPGVLANHGFGATGRMSQGPEGLGNLTFFNAADGFGAATSNFALLAASQPVTPGTGGGGIAFLGKWAWFCVPGEDVIYSLNLETFVAAAAWSGAPGDFPFDLCVLNDGTVWASMLFINKVRKFTVNMVTGQLTQMTDVTVTAPAALATDGAFLFVLSNGTANVAKIDPGLNTATPFALPAAVNSLFSRIIFHRGYFYLSTDQYFYQLDPMAQTILDITQGGLGVGREAQGLEISPDGELLLTTQYDSVGTTSLCTADFKGDMRPGMSQYLGLVGWGQAGPANSLVVSDGLGRFFAPMQGPYNFGDVPTFNGLTWVSAPGGGGGGTILINDHGVPIGPYNTIDFTGAGVTVINMGGGLVQVNIPGGGGGGFTYTLNGTFLGAATTLDVRGRGARVTFAAGTAKLGVDEPMGGAHVRFLETGGAGGQHMGMQGRLLSAGSFADVTYFDGKYVDNFGTPFTRNRAFVAAVTSVPAANQVSLFPIDGGDAFLTISMASGFTGWEYIVGVYDTPDNVNVVPYTLLVANPTQGIVERWRPNAGGNDTVGNIAVGISAFYSSPYDQQVWFSDSTGVKRIADPTNPNPQVAVACPAPLNAITDATGFCTDGTYVYFVSPANNTVYKVSVVGNVVLSWFVAGATCTAFDGKSLWVGSSGGIVQSFDPETGDLLVPFIGAVNVTSLMFDGTFMWVRNASGLRRYDQRTSFPFGQYLTASGPRNIVLRGLGGQAQPAILSAGGGTQPIIYYFDTDVSAANIRLTGAFKTPSPREYYGASDGNGPFQLQYDSGVVPYYEGGGNKTPTFTLPKNPPPGTRILISDSGNTGPVTITVNVATGDYLYGTLNGSSVLLRGQAREFAYLLNQASFRYQWVVTSDTVSAGHLVTLVPGGGGAFAIPLSNLTQLVAVDTTGGAKTVTLPVTPPSGTTVIVKDSGGQAAANNITITGTIDGVVGLTINANYASYSLVFNGTDWSIV